MFQFFLILIGFCVGCIQADQSEKVTLLQPGTKAPTFSLPTIDGDRVSLRTFCGDTLNKPHINPFRHIVVLSFWATYCEPCKKEIPELMNLAQNHTSDSIKIFCISIDKEGASKVGPTVAERKYTLPVLLDPYCKTAERYGVTSLPALFVISPLGDIFYSSSGYNENEPVDKKIDSIISQIRVKTINSDTAVSLVNTNNKDSISSGQNDNRATVSKWISPKTRWEAIVNVECGIPVASIADSLGINQDEIRKWFTELKKAATVLWDSTKSQ
jgi:peroxiredoxin